MREKREGLAKKLNRTQISNLCFADFYFCVKMIVKTSIFFSPYLIVFSLKQKYLGIHI